MKPNELAEMTDWHSVPVFGELAGHYATTIRPSSYGIISDREGRLAVVRTPIGNFLPGGGQDANESAEAAVIREASEECGLTLRLGTWRAAAIERVSSETEQTEFEKRSIFCEATAVGEPSHGSELDHELAWMSVAEAVEQLTPGSHRWAVGEWRSRR